MLNLTKEEIEMILGSLRTVQGFYKDSKIRFEAFEDTQHEAYYYDCEKVKEYENLIEKLSAYFEKR